MYLSPARNFKSLNRKVPFHMFLVYVVFLFASSLVLNITCALFEHRSILYYTRKCTIKTHKMLRTKSIYCGNLHIQAVMQRYKLL